MIDDISAIGHLQNTGKVQMLTYLHIYIFTYLHIHMFTGSVSAGSELIGPLTLTMGAVTRYAFAGRLTHLQIYDR